MAPISILDKYYQKEFQHKRRIFLQFPSVSKLHFHSGIFYLYIWFFFQTPLLKRPVPNWNYFSRKRLLQSLKFIQIVFILYGNYWIYKIKEREKEINKEKKVLFAEIKLFYRKTTMTNLFKKLDEFSVI